MGGIPGQEFDIVDRLLPDGSNATNEEDFINGYQLSDNLECKFTSQVSL